MALVAARLAEERPDEVALRDELVALSWADVNDGFEPGRQRARRARPRRRPPRGGVRRERRRGGAGAPRRPAGRGVDGAGELPPQHRRGGLHPLGTPTPGCCSWGPRPRRSGWPRPARPGLDLVIGWRCEPTEGITPWDTWLAAAADTEPPTDVAPTAQPHVHVGHHRPAQGRRAAPDDVRRWQDRRRAHRRAGQEQVRRVRHPPRGRSDVPHRPAVGLPAARRGRPRGGARSLRRRGAPADDRHLPHRDQRDGAHALRPPAGPPGGRAGALRRELHGLGRVTPARPARSTSSAR